MSKRGQNRKLAEFLTQKRAATMDELRSVSELKADISIYRSLKKLAYCSSYSHGGRYYALRRVARFGEDGLWTARAVWFSKHGTLSKTLENIIAASDRGCFADELEGRLHVGVRQSLLRLVNDGRVTRERISRSYLYCARSPSIRRRQLATHKASLGSVGVLAPDALAEEVKAAIVLFAALLDERQRRLFAGLETLQFGHDAESWIAEILGVHRQTVAKGRRELVEGQVDFGGIRKKGAGRPRTEKKRRRS